MAAARLQTLFVMLLVVRSSSSVAPRCLYEQYSLESLAVGRLTCTCRDNYNGNLNFLKQHLAQVSNNNPNIEVIISQCNTLTLHLNFNTFNNYNVILNIHNSNNTQISGVTMREVSELSQQAVQKISFRNIPGNITMTGHIKRSGLKQPELVVKVEQAGHLTLQHLLVDTPLKVTAKHLSSAVVTNSSISWLPWPGLYLFNVTRVALTGTRVRPLSPRSVVFLADVSHINISHNVFPNVSLAVNVEEFSSMTIRCNRVGEYQDPEPGCPPGPSPLSFQTPGPTILSVLEPGSHAREYNREDKESFEEEEKALSSSALTASDIYGLVWIGVAAALLVLVILAVVCCCCLARRTHKDKEANGRQVREERNDEEEDKQYTQREQGLNPIKEDEEEDGSSGSIARISSDPPASCESSIIPPPFITVNEVKASPGKGGVILGCLTLGPSFPTKHSTERSDVNNRLKQQTFHKIHKV